MSAIGTLGTVRNRTEVFVRYRQHARGGGRPLTPDRSADTGKLLAAALGSTDAENGHLALELSGTAGVAAVLPPLYVDFKEQIRDEMASIRRKMDELKGLHSRAALTHFDDGNRDEVEIEVITRDITRMFKKCEARLTKFGGQVCSNEADEKVKYNVQRTLALELQKTSFAFRKQQKQYLNRLRTHDDGGAFPILEEPSYTRDPDEYDPGFNELQAVRVDNMDLLAREREEEVNKIVSSINDLAQVMKDLAVLVIDQGTILDRIDYNINEVATRIDEGVSQLVKAEKKQKGGRAVMCIMLLLCAVIFMLIVVVFKAILF